MAIITIIKYTAPLFHGGIARRTVRSMCYDTSDKNIGLNYDSDGRTIMLRGPAAPEAARALVKAFGGKFLTITQGEPQEHGMEMVDEMKKEKHFVTFFSPGTFVPEQNCQEVKSWDVDAAVRLAGEISQRYGARPYAFRFHTMARGEKDFEPKTTKTGNLYFLGGKVRTLAEVEADNDPKEDILRSNMRGNTIKRVITNDNSWRFTGEFGDDDVLLDVKLPPAKKSA